MLDVRVYRAAFVPALIALFVVAFSLQGRPAAVRTRAIADAFDPARAYGSVAVRDSLLQLGSAFPDRRPGSSGDAALADRVGTALEAAGFAVSRTIESGRTVDGETGLETVVGVRPGRSNRRIVVLAHRDSLASPGLAELSGTAALLELARIFRTQIPSDEEEPGAPARPQLVGRDLAKTLVLVSTSGGTGGGAGARAWARAQEAGDVDAVLVLGDLASVEWHKPWVVPWSNGRAHPPLGWQRTVEVAARKEVGADPGGSRATAQWARRALPLTVGEQGEVNREGLPAVLLQISGERGPARGARVSRERFTELGRAALRSVIAVDEAGRPARGGESEPPFAGEPDGVVTLRNVLPGWSVRLMVLCLLLPALLAALDAFFRARRHKLRTGAWFAWALAGGAAIPLAWAWLRLLGIAGAIPAPRGPVLPAQLALSSSEAAALASVVLALAGGVLAGAHAPAAAAQGTRQPRGRRGRRRGRRDRVRRHVRRLARESVRSGAAAPGRPPVAAARRAADADARRARVDRARRGPARPGARPRRRVPGAADRAARAGAPLARGHGRRARLDVVGARARRARADASRRSSGSCWRGAASARRRRRSDRARAARGRTRDRARSAGPSRRCDADAEALDGPDRRGRAPPRRRRGDAAVGGAGLLALRPRPAGAARRRARRARARRADAGRAARARPAARPAPAPGLRGARAGPPDGARRGAGRLRAPAAGLSAVVVEGIAAGDLRRGPGHYPGTPLPGQRGTVAIAGHRTTYGAPFRRLDDLERGDRIELAMPYGRFAYRVEGSRIVAPSATWVTRRVAYDRLVLTACHPLYSAAERIVVFARLERLR